MKVLHVILLMGSFSTSLLTVGWNTEDASNRAARDAMKSPVIVFESTDSRLEDLESRVKMSPNPLEMLHALNDERCQAYRQACRSYEELLKEESDILKSYASKKFLENMAWYFTTEKKVKMHQRELNSPDSDYALELARLHQHLSQRVKFTKKAPEDALRPLAGKRK